ncbi:MAG: HepT-like ribonuclease domain-containing protein [Thermodesulfobacteriota bacterium]
MKDKEKDKVRIKHIFDAILEIQEYVKRANIEDFSGNSMMKYASIKQLEIIGEASNQISKETKSKYSYIEWKKIVAMRNALVHEYFGIDETIIWEIITVDLPKFKDQITKILADIK